MYFLFIQHGAATGGDTSAPPKPRALQNSGGFTWASLAVRGTQMVGLATGVAELGCGFTRACLAVRGDLFGVS